MQPVRPSPDLKTTPTKLVSADGRATGHVRTTSVLRNRSETARAWTSVAPLPTQGLQQSLGLFMIPRASRRNLHRKKRFVWDGETNGSKKVGEQLKRLLVCKYLLFSHCWTVE